MDREEAVARRRTVPNRPSDEPLYHRYPIAAAALIGLAVGGALYLFKPPYANLVFAAVAVLCGAPLLWVTFLRMLSGRFHVDTIAALAILVACIEREFLAG